jgi:hypothetical protein
MGRDISLIISKSIEVKIPKEIPHLIKDGVLLIALEKSEFSDFVFNVLRTYKTNLNDYIEENDFVKLVNKIKLNDFFAYHESDWGMPIDKVYFAVVEGEIVIESIESFKIEESDDQFIMIPEVRVDPRSILGMDLSNLDYYHSYYDFKETYDAESNL